MKKILIMDDSEELLELMDYIIDDLGVGIILSATPKSLSEIPNLSLDLIILDYYLGDLLGKDLCAEIRSYEQETHVPIVIVSAGNNICLECDADGSLSGPFEIEELEDRIGKFLR